MSFYPNYNQFYGQQQPIGRIQPVQQPIEQNIPQYPQPQIINKPLGLLGKSVDSIDVVKAMDIPLDGSISYFPIADGSAIVTKQLQPDGTSKTVVYKPIEEEKSKNGNYITLEELQKEIKKIENPDFKEEIKEIKKEIKEIKKELKYRED